MGLGDESTLAAQIASAVNDVAAAIDDLAAALQTTEWEDWTPEQQRALQRLGQEGEQAAKKLREAFDLENLTKESGSDG